MDPHIQQAVKDSLDPLKYRNKILIDYEAFCLHLYNKMLEIDEEMRKDNKELPLIFRMNYAIFKRTYTTLHHLNNKNVSETKKYALYIHPFCEERQSNLGYGTHFGLKLFVKSGLAELAGFNVDQDFSNLNQDDALIKLRDNNAIKKKYSWVQFDFDKIQEKYKTEIEANTITAHIVSSVSENAYLSDYIALQNADPVQFHPEQFSQSNRLCAFIDILGFKNLVEENAKAQNDNNQDEQFKASNFLVTLINIVKRYVAGIMIMEDFGDMNDMYSSIKFSTFSDTIVVSTDYLSKHYIDKTKCFEFFLDVIHTLQYELLCGKMLTRGAITFGNMYYYGDFYCGTAFVEAYEYGDLNNRYPVVRIHESAMNILDTPDITTLRSGILINAPEVGLFLKPTKPHLPEKEMLDWDIWFNRECINLKSGEVRRKYLFLQNTFLHNIMKIMKITLNGKEVSLTQEHSVESLLASLDIKQNNVAVEINCNLVPRSTYSIHIIADGDKIEIIHFVGGG